MNKAVLMNFLPDAGWIETLIAVLTGFVALKAHDLWNCMRFATAATHDLASRFENERVPVIFVQRICF